MWDFIDYGAKQIVIIHVRLPILFLFEYRIYFVMSSKQCFLYSATVDTSA